jgi:hypothetical protein
MARGKKSQQVLYYTMANNKTGMVIAVVALLLCCCCFLSLLGGGAAFTMSPAPAPASTPPASGASSADGDSEDEDEDEDEPEGANADGSPAGVVAKKCSRKVTATRTDTGNSQHGWGMNLRFKCNDTLVPIGSSGGGPKSHTVKFDGQGCPSEINKTNWEGRDTYPDKFKIDVGDCNL